MLNLWHKTSVAQIQQITKRTYNGRKWRHQVDSILLVMHVIGSEIYMKNLVAIEMIMLEEDFVKS